LKIIKREYVTAINVFDLEFQKNNLNLSRLWHEIQKPKKVLETIMMLIRKIENNRDQSPLSTIYNQLITATDSEIYNLFYFLFQKSIFPFLEMLGKWIYFGVIEDDFEEFMISEFKQEMYGDNNMHMFNQNYDWDERFRLRSNMVNFDKIGHFD
jgi:hypothetical protein